LKEEDWLQSASCEGKVQKQVDFWQFASQPWQGKPAQYTTKGIFSYVCSQLHKKDRDYGLLRYFAGRRHRGVWPG
jgi:hypothetical protein